DPREDLEQRRLARSVAPHDSEHLPGLDVERDVVERPDRVAGAVVRMLPPEQATDELLLDRPEVGDRQPELVLLGEALDRDRDTAHQRMSTNVRSTRLKYTSPAKSSAATAAQL